MCFYFIALIGTGHWLKGESNCNNVLAVVCHFECFCSLCYLRDDEHDKSDEDEDDSRIDFTVNNAATERQKLRDDFLATEHGRHEGSGETRDLHRRCGYIYMIFVRVCV